MGAFRTDPSITARGIAPAFDPIQAVSRIANLRRLQQLGRQGDLQLEDLERERARQETIRSAAAGAFEPGEGLNRAAFLQSLGRDAPLAALEFEGQFAEQEREAQKDAAALQKSQLENASKTFELVGQLAGPLDALEQQGAPIETLQVAYADSLARLQAQGVPTDKLPQQYSPGLARRALIEAVTEKDRIDQIIRASAIEERRRPVPGRDVPLPADVEAQRSRIATASRTPRLVPVKTVDDQGNAITQFVTPEVGATFEAPPTADMRNKEAARQTLIPAIDILQRLGQTVITEKLAVVQKAKSAGRSIDAALANDPEFRTYQDARMALAGNLAVAQQGSRPSDADVKAIWLPLVPNVFKDTVESARMKWQLIRINSGLPATEPEPTFDVEGNPIGQPNQ